jgi:nucleoside-diphosphate-sugar epimerase
MAVPGVFDEYAKKVDVVVHVATPLSPTDFVEKVIKPTWLINQNIFKAAAASGSVKRVIVTGTIFSTLQLPKQLFTDIAFSEDTWNPRRRTG